MSNEIANQRPSLTAFINQRIEELEALKKLASYYVESGTVPDSFYPSSKLNMPPEQRRDVATKKLAIAFQFGISAGLTESDVIQGVYVVNNIPQVWGKTMAKMIRTDPSCKDLSVDVEYDQEGNPVNATWTLIRKGSDREHKASFSKQRAIEANLWGKWEQNAAGSYTEEMLIWKALKRMRDLYIPEAASGFEIREDMEEVNLEAKKKEAKEVKGKALSQADIQAVLAQIEESYTQEPKVAKADMESVGKMLQGKASPQVVATNFKQAWSDLIERLSAEAGMEDANIVPPEIANDSDEEPLTEDEKERYEKLISLREKQKHMDIINVIESEIKLEFMSPDNAREALETFKEMYEEWKAKKQ